MNYNLQNYEQNKCFQDSGVDLSSRALTYYRRGPKFNPQDQKTKTSDKNTHLFSCFGPGNCYSNRNATNYKLGAIAPPNPTTGEGEDRKMSTRPTRVT